MIAILLVIIIIIIIIIEKMLTAVMATISVDIVFWKGTAFL